MGKLPNLKLKFENLGTENLVSVFVAVLTIKANLRNLIQDFSYAKLVSFAAGLLQYASLIQVAEDAWAEFKDLSVAEAKSVRQEVQKQFDIPDDDYEEAVEDAVFLAVDIYEWASKGRSLYGRVVAYGKEHFGGDPAA